MQKDWCPALLTVRVVVQMFVRLFQLCPYLWNLVTSYPLLVMGIRFRREPIFVAKWHSSRRPTPAALDMCSNAKAASAANLELHRTLPRSLTPLEVATMQTELLKVTGMTCGGCASNVTRALKTITGVGDVKVSVSAGEAAVQYDERFASPDQMKAAVKRAGYGVDAANAVLGQPAKGACCG